MGGEHWELPGKSISPALGGDPSLPTSLPPNCFWRSLCMDINTKRRQRLAYTLGEEERWPNFVLIQRYLLNTGILFFLCPQRKKSSSLLSPSDSQNSTFFLSLWYESTKSHKGLQWAWQPTPVLFLLENSMDRRAWWVTVLGVAESWTRLKWLSMHWYESTKSQKGERREY